MTSVGTTWGRLAFGVVYVVVLVAGVALGLRIMVDGYSPVPFADFWDQFPFIERGLRGDLGIDDSGHSGTSIESLSRGVQFLLDYGLFDGTNVFLFACDRRVQPAARRVFASAVWLDAHDWVLALGTLAVAVRRRCLLRGSRTSPGRSRSSSSRSSSSRRSRSSRSCSPGEARHHLAGSAASAGAALAAVAATYSMANGLVAWVVVVGLAGILRLRRRHHDRTDLVGVVTVFSFLWHFEFSTDGSLSDPVGVAKFVAVYLGSAVWGAGETAAALVGGIGIALFAVLCVLAWKDRAGRSVALPFGVGVATFVVLTAAQTAAGRLDLGTSQALSSRYSIGSFTFWLGIMVGFLLPLCGSRPLFPTGCTDVSGGCGGGRSRRRLQDASRELLPAHGRVRTRADSRCASRRHQRRVELGAWRSGRTGVAEALSWMARERLGPWAPGGMVDGQRVADTIEPTSRSCLGAIESNEPVGAGRQLRGWIAAPAGEPSSRNLVALDANRRRAGLGLVGAYRPDVRASAAVDSEWTGFVAYARGASTQPLDVLLLGEDRQTSLCRLESR